MKTIALITLIFILFSASCKKKKEICQWSHFTFEHPVSVYPIKESYIIGDTIWFEMKFSDVFNASVKNNYNGNFRNETIQLKNFDFNRNYLFFSQLLDSSVNINGQFDDVWVYFAPILLEGTILHNHHDGPEYRLSYSNDQYQLKIGIICNHSGRFICLPAFGHYYPISQGQLNEVDIRPECDVEHIEDIRFPVNKQADGTHLTNYHLFEQFMNPALENDLERIKKQCFTFVVN